MKTITVQKYKGRDRLMWVIIHNGWIVDIVKSPKEARRRGRIWWLWLTTKDDRLATQYITGERRKMKDYIIYYHGKPVGSMKAEIEHEAITNFYYETCSKYNPYGLTAFEVIIQ